MNHAKRRSSVRRLCVAGAAVLGAGALVAVTATANAGEESASPPPFLEVDELPTASTDWSEGAIDSGTGMDRFCLPDELPQDGTYHREFRTELETSASQIVFQADDKDAAEELVKKLNKSITDCATEYEQQYPDSKAEYKSLAKMPVADGGWVHGVATENPQSAKDLNLLGVGWNGDKVTVVNLHEYGTLDDLDSRPFVQTVDTAMTKLG